MLSEPSATYVASPETGYKQRSVGAGEPVLMLQT